MKVVLNHTLQNGNYDQLLVGKDHVFKNSDIETEGLYLRSEKTTIFYPWHMVKSIQWYADE